MQGEVLVAILNNKDDLNILYEQHWYRIPVASVNKLLKGRWPPRWLAFYQTKVFGKHAYAVRYYAEVIDIQEARRWDLFPDEPPNSKQKKLYYKLNIKPLQTLENPIFSRRWRRIIFIPTTWKKFISASEINDLYDGSPLEDRLWAALKRWEINAERQEWIKIKNTGYFLDFAVYCNQGKLNLETDGDTWHCNKEQARLDNIRDNEISTEGWRVLRFNTYQVKNEMNKYCIPIIKQNISRLGGLEKNLN